MDDLKRCVPPDPTPSWPEVARGTSIVLSTRAPSKAAQTITDPTPYRIRQTSNVNIGSKHAEY